MAQSLNNSAKARFMHRLSEFSTRGSKTGANLLGWEEAERLSPYEKRDCLVAASKDLQKKLRDLPKSDRCRKDLSKKLTIINKEISTIKPRYKKPGIQYYFMNLVKSEVTKEEFDRLLKAAIFEMAKAQQENNNATPL
jgi:dUTPase